MHLLPMHIPEAQSDPVPQGFPDVPEPVDIITFMGVRGGVEPIMAGGLDMVCAPAGIGGAPGMGMGGGVGVEGAV